MRHEVVKTIWRICFPLWRIIIYAVTPPPHKCIQTKVNRIHNSIRAFSRSISESNTYIKEARANSECCALVTSRTYCICLVNLWMKIHGWFVYDTSILWFKLRYIHKYSIARILLNIHSYGIFFLKKFPWFWVRSSWIMENRTNFHTDIIKECQYVTRFRMGTASKRRKRLYNHSHVNGKLRDYQVGFTESKWWMFLN